MTNWIFGARNLLAQITAVRIWTKTGSNWFRFLLAVLRFNWARLFTLFIFHFKVQNLLRFARIRTMCTFFFGEFSSPGHRGGCCCESEFLGSQCASLPSGLDGLTNWCGHEAKTTTLTQAMKESGVKVDLYRWSNAERYFNNKCGPESDKAWLNW